MLKDPFALLVPIERQSLTSSHILPPDQHPAAVYLARLAPRSRKTMRQALEVIAEIVSGGVANASTLSWNALRYQHTAAIRAHLADRYASATANKMLAALRGVLREAWRLGQLTAEDLQRASDFMPVRGKTLSRGRILHSGEIATLMSVCAQDANPSGIRDAALLAVLYGAGIRRGEIVALDLADYDQQKGLLFIRAGKGNCDRLAHMALGTIEALNDWLELRGSEAGALFWPVLKGGKLQARRVSYQGVLHILQRRSKEAGLKAFSPHDLRRTFVSHLLDAGVDLSTVQRLAGHASVQTTVRYDLRGEEAQRRAVGLLHVPRFRGYQSKV